MPRPYFHSKASALDEILRVNHAGEFGAVQIYEGQLASSRTQLLEGMLAHEKEHLEYFEKEMTERKARPTALIPLWRAGGYLLGRLTSLLGHKTAMLCTEAVEEVINEHYLEQHPTLLHINEKKLAEKVEEFRQDELHHKEIAIEYGSKDAPLYLPIKFLISKICKTAIILSKAI